MKNNDTLLKYTILISIGTISTKIISFLLVPLLTHYLNPVDFGKYDLLYTYGLLLIPLITLQIEQSIVKFSLLKKDDPSIFFVNALAICIFNIIIVNIILLLFFNNNQYIYSLILFIDSLSLYTVSIEYIRGTNKLLKYSIFNIINSLILIILCFMFLFFFNNKINGVLLSYGIAYLTSSLLIILDARIFKYCKLFNIKKTKEMIWYSVPLIPNAISWWITSVSDRTIIKFFMGNYFNGIYSVSCKIPNIVTILFGIFNTSWQQLILQIDITKNKEYISSIFNNIIKLMFSIILLIVCTLRIIFTYVFAKEYLSSMYYIPILLLATVFLSFSQFFSGLLMAKNKTKSIGKSTIFSAIINISINLLFIKYFGLFIACVSTLVSYLIMFYFRFLEIKEYINIKNIFSIIIYSILFIILSYIIIAIQNLLMICVILLIMTISFVIINKKIIFNYIYKIPFLSKLQDKKKYRRK